MSNEILKFENWFSRAWSWLKLNWIKTLAFALAILFAFLWLRTTAVNGYLKRTAKKQDKVVKVLKQEVIDTRKDFYKALDEIKKNEKLKPVFDSTATVTVLFDKMRNRFETDGITRGEI
jgi:hypothetical protein